MEYGVHGLAVILGCPLQLLAPSVDSTAVDCNRRDMVNDEYAELSRRIPTMCSYSYDDNEILDLKLLDDIYIYNSHITSRQQKNSTTGSKGDPTAALTTVVSGLSGALSGSESPLQPTDDEGADDDVAVSGTSHIGMSLTTTQTNPGIQQLSHHESNCNCHMKKDKSYDPFIIKNIITFWLQLVKSLDYAPTMTTPPSLTEVTSDLVYELSKFFSLFGRMVSEEHCTELIGVSVHHQICTQNGLWGIEHRHPLLRKCDDHMLD